MQRESDGGIGRRTHGWLEDDKVPHDNVSNVLFRPRLSQRKYYILIYRSVRDMEAEIRKLIDLKRP